MGRVNLRSQNAGPMTVAQGDESLVFLSHAEILTANTQLYTGGQYLSKGDNTLTLPTDGNRFSLWVVSGTVTFSGGTVETVAGANADIGKRDYVLDGGDWKIIESESAGVTFTTFDASTDVISGIGMYWMDLDAAGVLTIPAGLPDDHTFAVVREDAEIQVQSTAPEVISNPFTGADDNTAIINKTNEIAWFTKLDNKWRVAA